MYATCAVFAVAEHHPLRQQSHIKYFHQLCRLRSPNQVFKVYARDVLECLLQLGYQPDSLILRAMYQAKPGCTRTRPYARNSSSCCQPHVLSLPHTNGTNNTTQPGWLCAYFRTTTHEERDVQSCYTNDLESLANDFLTQSLYFIANCQTKVKVKTFEEGPAGVFFKQVKHESECFDVNAQIVEAIHEKHLFWSELKSLVNVYYIFLAVAFIINVIVIVLTSGLKHERNQMTFYLQFTSPTNIAWLSYQTLSVSKIYMNFLSLPCLCHFELVFKSMIESFMLHLILSFSIERCAAVHKPIQWRAWPHKKTLVYSVLGLGQFIVMFILILRFFLLHYNTDASDMLYCGVDTNKNTVFIVLGILQALEVVIPWIIILILNISIVVCLIRLHKKRAALNANTSRDDAVNVNKTLTLSLLGMVSVYLLTHVTVQASDITQFAKLQFQFDIVNGTAHATSDFEAIKFSATMYAQTSYCIFNLVFIYLLYTPFRTKLIHIFRCMCNKVKSAVCNRTQAQLHGQHATDQ